MSGKPDGGPAFPSFFPESKTRDGKILRPRDEHSGLSMRDYFAAAALPALIAEYVRGNGTCMGADHFALNLPKHAFALADAMLAERARS